MSGQQHEQAPNPEPQNQGIPYTLRRIQIMDGIILSAIIAVFSIVYGMDQKLTEMKAERDAQEKVDADNPPVRRVRYELEVQAVRDHVRAVDGRVTELEDKLRE
jgi:hypothetical protein